jgi:hypothetical protein
MRRFLPITLLLAVVAAPAVRAEDKLYLKTSKDKPAYTAFVKQETPRGVKLDGVKQEIAADDIRDIVYLVEPISLRLKYYQAGVAKETAARASADEKKRAELLAEAIQLYEDTILQLKEDFAFAKRHAEFKVALLRSLQAQDDGEPKSLDLAITRLKEFKTKHPQSWQLSTCLKQLGQLLVERGDYADAEQTYRELAQADVADATRQEAELLSVQVSLKAGQILLKQGKQAEADQRFADAEKKLAGLHAALPKGSPQGARVQLALAECLGAAKKLPGAKKLVQEVIAATKKEDKSVKALAYNTLGFCYYLNEQWQEARWQFLWVDAVYHQDKVQHAKALYYLADIFARLGEKERGQEFLDTLRNDRQFAGLEYQRRALREGKKD